MSIMVWGHRGHRHHRLTGQGQRNETYENSLRAYEQTLSQCMGIECDVIKSKDATIYLIHDTLFDGIVQYGLKGHLQDESVTDNRYIYQIPDSDIGQMRLKDGQPIPKLRELLEMMRKYPGRILNLELKGPNTADIAVRTVERAIQEDLITPEQIVFSSFNFPALRDLRSETGYRFKLGVMFALHDFNLTPMFPNWPNAPQDASYIPFRTDLLNRSDLRDIDPDYVHVESRSLNEEAIQAIAERSSRAKIVVWTAGEPHPNQDNFVIKTVQKYASSGKIYAVLSDFPSDVQAHLLRAGVKVKTS